MSSDFQPPPKNLSILASVGGVVTAVIAIAILNGWSKQLSQASIEKPEISTSETASRQLVQPNKPQNPASAAKLPNHRHWLFGKIAKAIAQKLPKSNGAPGFRTHYHPNYYAAFILDPDGHNIEAVCHYPE